MKKYIVKLTQEEREELVELVSKGRRAASVILRARILLKADISEDGPEWSDAKIVDALESSSATVHRVRQQFVEEGFKRALYRKKPTGRQYRKLDGEQEAQLIKIACSSPPQGRESWTLSLLADRLVELNVVESISPECVRTTLKKTGLNRGTKSSG